MKHRIDHQKPNIMQVKFFTIPIVGGEKISEELNVFLRSKKVLETESQLVQSNTNVFWCFCIKYLEEPFPSNRKPRVDYKEILNKLQYQKFLKFKDIRKRIAKEEAIPAYAVFTDEELSEIVKLEPDSLSKLNEVKGVGKKKIEKYGQYFMDQKEENETS